MEVPLHQIIGSYNDQNALEKASTIPASWYTDNRLANLERQNVFGRTWQMVARLEQLREPGQFVATELTGEPIVLVRSEDNQLRAFYNVCRHHAAAVVTAPCGVANILRCPYHGWSYGLDGALKAMTEFEGVCDFDRSQNGLVPIRVDAWEHFVFITLDAAAGSLAEFLGRLTERVAPLNLTTLKFFERRTYDLNCNWKVFVDNYLDGGYHVPHLHKGLNSVLDPKQYAIEIEDRYCLQSSPIVESAADATTAASRLGDRASYFWQYPNFMINHYQGYMDTNLVVPNGIDRCRVIFEFYFDDVSADCTEKNRRSIAVAEHVNDEDLGICEDVQRGLYSRAYGAGRLSVRREAGEHLFHRLLASDLKRTR